MDSRLFVLGGVFDYFTIDRVPGERLMELAIILQSDEGDLGVTRTISVEMRGPDGDAVLGADSVSLGLPTASNLEHFSVAMTFVVRYRAAGRHVTQVFVDDEPTCGRRLSAPRRFLHFG